MHVMVRLSIIAMIGISARLFAAPSLCTLPTPETIVNESGESAMENCDDHMASEKNAQKRVPCDHMKQCLQNVGSDDTFFQNAASATALTNWNLYAFYVPVLSSNLYSLSSDMPLYSRPPPATLFSQPPVYKTKSSFLI